MQIRVENINEKDCVSDTLVISYFEGVQLYNSTIDLCDEVQSMVSGFVRDEEFTGKYGEIISFRIARESNPKNIIILGLGKQEELCLEKIRNIIGKCIKEAKKLKSKSLYIAHFDYKDVDNKKAWGMAVSEGALLADYKFNKYKSDKKESQIIEVNICCDADLEDIEEGVYEGYILAKSTIIARELVNEPANILGPSELANAALNLSKESGFEIDIYDEITIRKMGMYSYLEVAKGSDKPPRFIVMRYLKDPENKENILGLVGKGLTYDSGGYSIKPTDGMLEMKSDMAGGAAVMASMYAIGKMKLKTNVIAVIAACENMISGRAYRPGDIIKSMGGKTIEVVNTDAEGRLTLIDAVNYIIEKENVTRVVDIATLTGAALVALGTDVTAGVSNNDEFYMKYEKATNLSGEKVWRLPHFKEYKEQIKSQVADLKNSGGKYAGTITAALFIGEFVKDLPWIHLDIAGPSWAEKDMQYISEGGTGVGVRSLYHLIKNDCN